MKKGILIGLIMTAFSTGSVWAEGDQQTRMKMCNADAKQQSLAGDARKAFMKTCLSGASKKAATPAVSATKAEPAASTKSATPAATATSASPVTGMNQEGKPMTAQQQRMKDCNAEAKSKEMKGDPRKAFMKNCLSNKKQG